MSDIFLSYASQDRGRVRPLAAALAVEGWSVFWDRNIPIGKTWDEMLEEEFDSVCSLVVVWSNQATAIIISAFGLPGHFSHALGLEPITPCR